MAGELVLGIDVGTQGARVAAVDASGSVIAQATRTFDAVAIPGLPTGHLEQHPEDWWSAVAACLTETITQLGERGRGPEEIVAVAIDSTSGTIALLDAANRPLRPALMYNDRRAEAEAEEINAIAADFIARAGYRFNSSFALPRLLWLKRNEPDNWVRARHIVHAADYIAGCLTGRFDITDQGNALKTGFDLIDFRWPDFIENQLGIEGSLLPNVIRSGEPIGPISHESAAATGLAVTTLVVAGTTDGSADQIASGAREAGDWNTVLGTTIILKGLTRELLKDPRGRVYCHLHPSGLWMPGGAGNIGARALDEHFPGVDKTEFDAAAVPLSPTGLLVYPLLQAGERFPFVAPDAVGFIEGDPVSPRQLYAAHLEGIGFIECLSYEVVAGLGAPINKRIFTTGGGARSIPWMQIRADILNRELARAANANAVMGSALIAASASLYPDLAAASRAMVRIECSVAPRPEFVERYGAQYRRFLEALVRRGYL